MAHRCAVALLCLVVIAVVGRRSQAGQAGVRPERRRRVASSRSASTRRKGPAWPPWTTPCGPSRRTSVRSAACRRCSRTPAAASSAAVNQGNVFVRIAPHEERVFSLGRFLKDLVRLRPQEAFRGNYSQRDVMVEIRRRLSKLQGPALVGAQLRLVQHRRRQLGHRLRAPRPRPRGALGLRRGAAQPGAELGGIVDADTTLEAQQARAPGARSTASAPRPSASRCPTWRRRSA